APLNENANGATKKAPTIAEAFCVLLHVLLEAMQNFVARQYLTHTGVGFSALFDGGKEFPVLKLDTIHGYVHLAHINGLFLAIDEVIVARNVSAIVTDVAEEGAERSVVVEREGQRTDFSGLGFELNGHVHGNAQFRMLRTLYRIG